jgi:hypothetical protein
MLGPIATTFGYGGVARVERPRNPKLTGGQRDAHSWMRPRHGGASVRPLCPCVLVRGPGSGPSRARLRRRSRMAIICPGHGTAYCTTVQPPAADHGLGPGRRFLCI